MTHPSDQTIRVSIGQRILLGMLVLYRGLFSPMYAGSCRFVPSCSEYARDAVAAHGAIKGGWLALRRLSRCRPAGSYGLDPVPQRASRLSR